MNPPFPSVDQRVEQLERAVGQLQQAVGALQRGGQPFQPSPPHLPAQAGPPLIPAAPAFRPAPFAAPPEPELNHPQPAFDLARSAEFWLNKLGIGLFLLGIMFFFKYSIDRGWITPLLRVVMGGLTGGGFVALGLRIQQRRRGLSQVLLGGGVGILYISIFAAYQLYGLITYPLAFGAMMLTTLLGFGLALRQNHVTLALIAAAGGLITPFVLYSGTNNVPGLVAYTTMMLVGISAIYFFKGWRSLLWLAFAATSGIWLVSAGDLGRPSPDDLAARWALQAGIAASWLIFWLVPIAMAVWQRAKSAWTPPADQTISLRESQRISHHAHQLTVISGLWGLSLTSLAWQSSLDRFGLGVIALGGAAAYALIGVLLADSRSGRDFASTQIITATALLTIAITLLLKGDALFWTLAAEAAAMHLLARRFDEPLWSFGGHGLAALVGVIFLSRLDPTRQLAQALPLLNPRGLTDLGILLMLGGISWALPSVSAATFYRLAAYVGLLGLIWREWTLVNNAFVTIGWGLCGLTLLVIALRRANEQALWVASATIGLVTAKLFFVDLVAVDALWRMLLFLGFGGVFLAASYFFRTIWRPRADQPI